MREDKRHRTVLTWHLDKKWAGSLIGSALIEKTISHDYYGRDIFIFIAESKTLDWMAYTIYSDNEPRVAEIAEVDLN